MGRGAKVGVVCAGYLLAFIAGGVAGHLYNARVSALPYDTSGGMYAAGESMSALGAFLVVALAPTSLALWFLRGNGKFWQAVALVSLGFAGAGLLAVLMPLVFHGASNNPVVLGIELFSLAHLLGMPLWTVAFVLFALLAPTRPARRLLVAAIGVELVVGLCAAIHWFVPSSPL
jgi:hypothetical protein